MMLSKTTSILIRPDRLPHASEDSTCTWPPFTLVGRSRAGEGTSFAIPELKWIFDCGALVQGWKPVQIFLTHTHCDHVHFLTHLKDNSQPPLVYLPMEATPFVEAFLRTHQEMTECMTENEGHEGRRYKQDLQLIPTRINTESSFRQGGNEYIIRTVECDHRIPCLGYSIFRRKNKLKDEYIGRPGSAIGLLRKQGVEVTDSYLEPFLLFLGDTTHKVFETYPLLLDEHKIVVVECSFTDEKDLERADTTKHMHWRALKPSIDSHPNVLFVLIHFTLKQKSLDLRRFFLRNSKQHRNVHPMLIHEEIDIDWKKAGKRGAAPCCNCFMCGKLAGMESANMSTN